MNIFHLSTDLERSARYHIDKHVVKMQLEHVQLLSTANRICGLDEGYRPTHQNHPCAVWVRESIDNWLYLKDLTIELHKEWQYRYQHRRNHKSFDVLMTLSTPPLPKLRFTTPPKCMPDDAKLHGVVASYRNYYSMYKRGIATYTGRPVPKFFTCEG